MENNYYVLIVRYNDGKYIRKMGPMSEAQADRASRGALVNMDRENYYSVEVTNDELEEYEAAED